MKINRMIVVFGVYFAALACSWSDVNPSWGQKPPPPANPQGPTINPLVPAGVQRGKAVDLIITGTQLAGPTGASLGVPANITIPTEDKNGQDASKFKIRVEVPADTPVGWYPFRVATSKGVSNLRVLCVDDLPQFVGKGDNRAKSAAQEIPVPCAVTGSILAEQGDYYKFTVKAGQRLSFDCQARRIGSAIDAYMYIYDAKNMRELVYDNDSPGCQTDPRISYTFKEAGEYILEIKDVLNRGGPEFVYRVRIGDFPLATTAIPMAAKRGAKAKIHFAGPAVEGVAPVEIDVPTDPALNVVWVAPLGPTGLHGWPVLLALSDHDEGVEQEPNDEPKQANRVAVPGGITGRFQKAADTDYYIFAAKKGQKLAIEARTLEYYSPSLLRMSLKNAKGAEIAKTNSDLPLYPAFQRIDFTAAEDGEFLLEAQQLSGAGGPSESYHLTVRPAANSFDLVLPNERFDVAPGGAAAIPVQVARKGYGGPIELSVVGNSNVSGKATIKAGQNAALLLVTAKDETPMGAYQFHIVGKAMVDGQAVTQTAGARGIIVQSLNGLPYPPMHLQTFVALAVKEKAPFSLAIKIDPPDAIPGSVAKVTITATRDAGFDDEITLAPPTGLPPTVPAPKAIPAIAKGKTETSFSLDLNAKTPLGEYFLLVTAKTKSQGREFTGSTPPLLLVLGPPFELQVEPATVSLSLGGKAKIKVTAQRKGGYKGPIALDLRNLPPGVTAAKAPVIAAGKNDIDIDIAADAKAAPASAANVIVGGTATALNNLQNVSPSFSVNVQKK
jgi:Bacterial pre-peptidase C-terminal domain